MTTTPIAAAAASGIHQRHGWVARAGRARISPSTGAMGGSEHRRIDGWRRRLRRMRPQQCVERRIVKVAIVVHR
jgi:hypothetical protein